MKVYAVIMYSEYSSAYWILGIYGTKEDALQVRGESYEIKEFILGDKVDD